MGWPLLLNDTLKNDIPYITIRLIICITGHPENTYQYENTVNKEMLVLRMEPNELADDISTVSEDEDE